MATDMIARMMAMSGGGAADAYTKAETDALLADKADLANGKIPAAQLPSYVDDTIEGYLYNGAWYEDAQHTAEVTGESGKIYVDLVTNRTYRWSGSAFVEISESLALGETSSTAYAGNKGKANADAIAAMKDGQSIDSFGDVETALSRKANTSDLGAAAAKGFDAVPTSGNTDNAVSSDGVYQALSAKLNTADSMKLVYRHFLGQNSGTVSYRMATTDFAAIDNAQQCGMYLIAIIKWSATPTASIYIAYYSGGTLAYNALAKIGGADAQVEIDTERNIIYTGTGKIQIYALR